MQLSVYRGASGVQALMKSNARQSAEEDESLVMASGIPYTIVRAGLLTDTPGGKQGFNFTKVLVIQSDAFFPYMTYCLRRRFIAH